MRETTTSFKKRKIRLTFLVWKIKCLKTMTSKWPKPPPKAKIVIIRITSLQMAIFIHAPQMYFIGNNKSCTRLPPTKIIEYLCRNRQCREEGKNTSNYV